MHYEIKDSYTRMSIISAAVDMLNEQYDAPDAELGRIAESRVDGFYDAITLLFGKEVCEDLAKASYDVLNWQNHKQQ